MSRRSTYAMRALVRQARIYLNEGRRDAATTCLDQAEEISWSAEGAPPWLLRIDRMRTEIWDEVVGRPEGLP